MRQLLTIFFLSNMLMLQYSRQAAYLQCQLINAIESKHCDCEKILEEEDHTIKEHNSLPGHTIKTGMPDECFLFAKSPEVPIKVAESKTKPTAFIIHFTPQPYTGKLIQPPRA